jgi:hypothetical protein
VRIPTFSRQSNTDTAADERPTVATGSTVARPDETTPPRYPRAAAAPDRKAAQTHANRAETAAHRAEVRADRAAAPTLEQERVRDHGHTGRAAVADRTAADRTAATDHTEATDRTTAPAGPKPRASLLATLGLILGVVAALLVLSGPVLGYGIGVAVLALILSLSGIHATGRRHVAGKTDALIGMVLSLAAIVVGVLALTGSLSWLGTDMQPVTTLREWLDAQFVDRF